MPQDKLAPGELPNDINTEQAVLGSMMISREALFTGLGILQPSDFYRSTHPVMFEALRAIGYRDEPIDLITMQEELRKRGKLEEIGGTEYLMACVDAVPTAAAVEHYANIVKHYSTARRIAAIGVQIHRLGLEAPEGIEQRCMDLVLANQTTRNGQVKDVNHFVEALSAELERRDAGEQPFRIPFSLQRLNRAFKGGLGPGQLLVVGGDTSEGKTIILCDLIEQARRRDIPVLVITCEMTGEEYLTRLICSNRRIDSAELEAQGIPWTEVGDGLNDYFDRPIDIRDTAPSLAEIEVEARTWALRRKATDRGLIVVDYAGLIKRKGRPDEENTEVARNIDALKELAGRLRVGVATASQLRKEPTQTRRANPVDTFSLDTAKVPFPKLDDLLGARAISASADKVLMLYNPREAPLDAESKRPAFMFVAKHRNGRAGQKFRVWFQANYTRFDDCEEQL